MTIRLLKYLLLVLLLNGSKVYGEVNIAIVRDGPDRQSTFDLRDVFKDEISGLLDDEFTVNYIEFPGDLTRDGIVRAIDSAASRQDIDIILVLGLAANQLAIQLDEFTKPTFLPIVFDPALFGVDPPDNASNIENLNFVRNRIDLASDLASVSRLVPIKRVVILADQSMPEMVPELVGYARQQAAESGIDLFAMGHDGKVSPVLAALDSGEPVEAVLLADLFRFGEAEQKRLLNEITSRGIATFSLLGPEAVELGALATDAPATDWTRLARRMALNIQDVLLGGQVSEQPIDFESRHQLVINMETARRLGVYPSFDVLADAELINEYEREESRPLSLEDIAVLALTRNLDLEIGRRNPSIGDTNVREAKSGLLPRVDATLSAQQRRNSPSVMSGMLPRRTEDASVRLSQQIYVDRSWAAYRIQQYLKEASTAGLQSQVLDTTFETTTAFVAIHRAETNLRIQKENLSLIRANLDRARNRTRVGATSAADVYRWESELANARAVVIKAESGVAQAREALNVLLDLPITQRLNLIAPSIENTFQLEVDEFDAMVTNRQQLARFTDYQVLKGLERAPELEQLNAQQDAKTRELDSAKRSFWLPEVTLGARASENLHQTGSGPGDQQDDWVVDVTANYPITTSGARAATREKRQLELEQLNLQVRATQQVLEQRIRAAVHQANASYASIELSEAAAASGKQNLALVIDAYVTGTVSVIDLLDAQNASVQADLNAANAVYDFLTDMMAVERSIGMFTFLESEEAQQEQLEEIREHINNAR